MALKFEAKIQRRKKYDYHKEKKYTYEQMFIIIPKSIAEKLKKKKKVKVTLH